MGSVIAARGPNINTPGYWDRVYRRESDAGALLTLRDYGSMHDLIVELIPPGSRVLDVGCGPGILCRKVVESVAGVRVTGVDFSAYVIAANAERDAELGIEYRCFDVQTGLGATEQHFDVVTMCEILEHLDEPEQVVAAALELVRPGGLFILTCPHDGQVPHAEHVREWGHDEVFHLLAGHTGSVTFHQLPAPRDRWLFACCTTPDTLKPHRTGGLLDQLRALGLPTYRAVTVRERSAEEKAAAADGCFTVFGQQIDLRPSVDWHQNPFDSRSGVYELHTLQFLDVLIGAYSDDGDASMLKQALALALDWVAANDRDNDATNDFAWYDMAVGLRAPYLAYLLRASAHAEVLSETDAEALLKSLVEHGQVLAADENYANGHNHGLFQDEGLLLLAGYLPFLDEAATWRSVAWPRCLRTLHETIEWDEGVHLEHSPAYHLAITNYVRRIVDLADADRAELAPLLERLEETAGWLVLPDGTLPELGDTEGTPVARWATRSAEVKHGLKILLGAGLAVVKEEDSFLIVSAWYHGRGHKHADELSFVLYEAGQRVIGDSGRYGYYEDDQARRYARSSQAHNALIVDDESFDWQSAAPYGSGIVSGGSGDGWYAIEGTNPLLRDVEHRRVLLFRPGIALVVVDEVTAATSHSFSRLLHFGAGVEVEARTAGLSIRADGFCGAVANWTDAAVEWSLVKGQHEPSLSGWTYPRDREALPVWTAELTSTGSGLTSAMAIALHDESVCVTNVQRVDQALSVSVDLNGEALRISATSNDGNIEISQASE